MVRICSDKSLMVKASFTFAMGRCWGIVTFETCQFFDFFLIQWGLLPAFLVQVVLGCLEKLPTPLIRNMCSLVSYLPVGAYGHRMALVAAARRRYALPGSKHGTACKTHGQP